MLCSETYQTSCPAVPDLYLHCLQRNSLCTLTFLPQLFGPVCFQWQGVWLVFSITILLGISACNVMFTLIRRHRFLTGIRTVCQLSFRVSRLKWDKYNRLTLRVTILYIITRKNHYQIILAYKLAQPLETSDTDYLGAVALFSRSCFVGIPTHLNKSKYWQCWRGGCLEFVWTLKRIGLTLKLIKATYTRISIHVRI